MLAEFKCPLEKREEDILCKEINKKFNSYIASHPKLTINFEEDIIHAETKVTVAMGNIKELWPYSISVRENDGKECYEVYYLMYVDDSYTLAATLAEAADVIATHFVKYVWDVSESKNSHVAVNNARSKLEARIARLEKMIKLKNESDEPDEYDSDIAILLKEYIKAARAFSDAAEQIMYWTKHEYNQYNNDRSKKDYYLWEDIHDNSLLFIPDYSDNEDLISFVKEYI